MKVITLSLVAATLLISSSAFSAIYQGKNIDNTYYHCSGTVTDSSGNSKSSDRALCKFSGRSLSASLDSFPSVTFKLPSETIQSNRFHFTKRVLLKKYKIDLIVNFDTPQQPSNFYFYSK